MCCLGESCVCCFGYPGTCEGIGFHSLLRDDVVEACADEVEVGVGPGLDLIIVI